RAPDLIGRDFATEQLNRKWYGDGTEIDTDEGKLYLDSVLDMGSRRIACVRGRGTSRRRPGRGRVGDGGRGPRR
ncbi:MAG TPA: IS3 family transposase, partial [Blastococcus sp.]